MRSALARYGVAEPAGWNWPGVYDAGDIEPAPGDDATALAETHRRVSEAVAAIVRLGLMPIGIGGGHDLTFPFVRALVGQPAGRHASTMASERSPSRLGLVFLDAHLDVRPEPGSGMAFRRLIEDCGVGPVVNIGFNPLANARGHVAWFEAHGGRIEPDVPSTWPLADTPQFVSVDLDCLEAPAAPGVSAPNPAGLRVPEVARLLHHAGRNPNVQGADFMELNPAFDPDGRTARTAAHLLMSFLRGVAERPT